MSTHDSVDPTTTTAKSDKPALRCSRCPALPDTHARTRTRTRTHTQLPCCPDMDSMRSLNTSLPRTKRQPDVHQAFRTAALTVTNLYKSALADLDRARSDGYQEALDDLLALLDKENLGVDDGEGWRIRQWATERLDGALPRQPTSDSDDDDMDDKRARSSSPIMERNNSPDDTRSLDPAGAPAPALRSDSAPPVQMEASVTEPDLSPLHQIFQFTASQPYPSSAAADAAATDISAAARRAFPAPRRSSNRAAPRNNLQRTVTQNLFQLGNGAGQKRRLMHDFFNIDGPNDRRDGSAGGPKRGRMT
jgi:hypothetical protein